jgi:hypothetical protein
MSTEKPFVAFECWNSKCDHANRAGVQLRLTADEVVRDALDIPHCPGCRLPVIGTHQIDRTQLTRVIAMLGGAALGASLLGLPGVMLGVSLGYVVGEAINTSPGVSGSSQARGRIPAPARVTCTRAFPRSCLRGIR